MYDGFGRIAVGVGPGHFVLGGTDTDRDGRAGLQTGQTKVFRRHIGLCIAERVHPEHLTRHGATVVVDQREQQRSDRGRVEVGPEITDGGLTRRQHCGSGGEYVPTIEGDTVPRQLERRRFERDEPLGTTDHCHGRSQ